MTETDMKSHPKIEKILWILVILCAVMTIPSLMHGRMFRYAWIDEAVSILMSEGSFLELLEALRYDSGPPLFYVLLSLWMKLFGNSEFGTRVLSLLFHLATVGGVYLVGRTLFDRESGRIAAILYVCSPLAARHAVDTRMYVMVSCWTIFSTLYFARIFLLNSKRPRDVCFYALTLFFGMMTHYWFAFVMMAQFASVLVVCCSSRERSPAIWSPARRTVLFRLVLAAGTATLLMIILWGRMFLLQWQNDAISWIPRPQFFLTFGLSIMDFVRYGTVATIAYAVMGLAIVLGLCGKGVATCVDRLAGGFRDQRVLCLLALIIVALAVPLGISQFKPIYWIGRQSIVGLAPFAVLLGGIFARCGVRVPVLLGCLILCVGFCVVHASPQMEYEGCRDRDAALAVQKRSEPHDVLLFPGLSRGTVEYNLLQVGARDRFQIVSFPENMALHRGWMDVKALQNHPQEALREAMRVVGRITERLQSGQQVFLFNSRRQTMCVVLGQLLEKEFRVSDTINIGGSYYEEIVVYERE